MRLHHARDRRSQAGAAAVIMAVFIAALMIPLGAIGVDVARWYVEAERVQAAADAAATAGVTYMPDDFPKAQARALEIAEDNGFRNGSNATVTVSRAHKPTQLRVTISSDVRNQFGQVIGIETARMSRSAVADYNGPAPMGSPCNTFGNEPKGTSGTIPLGPVGSQLDTTSATSCTTEPDFWASLNGPDIHKTQGEQFLARNCAGTEDSCTWLKKNSEFDPLGYFYIVRVTKLGSPVTIQIYDPAAVPTGQQCELRPLWGSSATNTPNDYLTDARLRYGGPDVGDTTLCPGDNDMRPDSSTPETPTVTSFGLREPVDTEVPVQGTPITTCAKQYRGYSASQVTKNALTKTSSSYNAGLASVFHQWNTLCTFNPTEIGDYYLQVRSNVAFNGASTAAVTSGNPAIFSQMTDDTAVRGTSVNSFALRAFSANRGVSVSAWKRMRIFVNGPSATTTFNLVRVIPASYSKTLKFGFFDVGEGAASGATMRLLPPVESSPTLAQNCKATGFRNVDLPNCSLPISTAFNGKQQYITAPIPIGYTCNEASQGGCWWRVQVNFATSDGVHDATTWTADIGGEPVRLIE